jgi:hypothetical protein
MMQNKKVFDLGNYTLTVFDDPSLDEHSDASDEPDVLIDLEMKRDDGEAKFSVKCHGQLSEKRVVDLITALNEALERARAAAKERGYYEFVAAAEKEGLDRKWVAAIMERGRSRLRLTNF